ncbi:MAG: 2-C-methyl-D-erythritol 4-phosphate cytidylyltransferase [Pedobacter sp.]|nr:MAG: 2-C-methyl-D-erythritol 4-phosphate cytidylyltransferase [Pedobacter sp.]
MNHFAIIVAGGTGKRMSENIPKQFLNLAGKPILMHTISRFAESTLKPSIIVVLPGDSIDFWMELCKKYAFNIKHLIVEGGQERYFSVKNALAHIPTNSIVAIHDAVRPLLSNTLILNTFKVAAKHGTAIPYIKSSDSLRHLSPQKSGVINREEIALVQTPQTFQSEILIKAYQLPYQTIFTDDASVVESAGNTINLIEGERQNIKITFPLDLKLAELIIADLGSPSNHFQ